MHIGECVCVLLRVCVCVSMNVFTYVYVKKNNSNNINNGFFLTYMGVIIFDSFSDKGLHIVV